MMQLFVHTENTNPQEKRENQGVSSATEKHVNSESHN